MHTAITPYAVAGAAALIGAGAIAATPVLTPAPQVVTAHVADLELLASDGLFGGISDMINTLFGSFLGDGDGNIFNSIGDMFNNLFASLFGDNGFFSGITDMINNLFAGIQNFFNDVMASVQSLFNDTTGMLGGAAAEFANAASAVSGDALGNLGIGFDAAAFDAVPAF